MAHGEHEQTSTRGRDWRDRLVQGDAAGRPWAGSAFPDAYARSSARPMSLWRSTVSFAGCRAFGRWKIRPATVARAAWAVVLSRHGGSDDVLFTCQLRRPGDLPLPLRVRVDAKASVSAWLERFESRLRTAEERVPVPQALAAELADAEGGCGDTAFFFVHGRRLEEARGQAERCHCPLRVYALPDLSAVEIEYAAHVFSTDAIAALARHMDVVIQGMAADPGRSVGALPLLSPEEEHLLLHELNSTAASFPDATCIHELFAQQVARTPDAIALVCGEGRWTYREASAKADVMAARLRAAGVRPGALAAISLGRSLDLVTAQLGVLKAGGAYVPLDPGWSAGQLRAVLDHARPLVAIVSTETEHLFSRGETRTLRVDERAPGGDNGELFATASSDAAYVAYAPRPGGAPQGAVITHRNVANLFAAMDGVIGREPGVWMAVMGGGVAGGMSVIDLLWTLSRGFRVILRPGDVSKAEELSPTDIGLQIRRHGVTHLQCTPSFAALLAEPQAATALRQLRRLLIGGPALSPAVSRRLAQGISRDGRVFNLYGLTETTVWSIAHRVALDDQVVPIGRPVANTRAYVLDASRRLVPIGRAGELYIGGEGVAKGYLNNPELTRDRFIVNPFNWDASDRLFRTGDIVRRQLDGSLVFLGHRDG